MMECINQSVRLGHFLEFSYHRGNAWIYLVQLEMKAFLGSLYTCMLSLHGTVSINSQVGCNLANFYVTNFKENIFEFISY